MMASVSAIPLNNSLNSSPLDIISRHYDNITAHSTSSLYSSSINKGYDIIQNVLSVHLHACISGESDNVQHNNNNKTIEEMEDFFTNDLLEKLPIIDENISSRLHQKEKLENIPVMVISMLRVAIAEITRVLERNATAKIGPIIRDYMEIAKDLGHKYHRSFINAIAHNVAATITAQIKKPLYNTESDC
jgi:transcription termination factor NusB